ncbi:MAG: DUF2911 domain-containing protein [Vicinamibacterales bacterium]|jgi:hypothetical protein|nr:DUF2911 domain-containing protein [Vicinamibacterales bacterium]
MPCRRAHSLSIGVLSGLTLLAAGAATAQSDDPDGLAHTRLTLSARVISVAYEPTLRANDPAHAALLAGPSDSAVHIGRLEGNRALRVGTLGPDQDETPRSGPNHELWLTRRGAEWMLDARPIEETEAEAENEDENQSEADEAPEPVLIPLTHTSRTDARTEYLLVALQPGSNDSGALAIDWGAHSWRVDFEFVELPSRPRPERTSNVGPATSLTRDSDTTARWRGARLGTRSETAFTTPDGQSIQILYQKEHGTDHRDFAALESTADGELVELSGGAVIRLRSEVPLRFGDTLIPTDNLAPDFPGSYGLWLKAAGENWRLVFNHEADSWGTQHDPAFDAAEIELTHAHGGPGTDRPLAVYLVPRADETDEDTVGLIIHWGQHTWEADFSVEP